jgi:hypothetical protein
MPIYDFPKGEVRLFWPQVPNGLAPLQIACLEVILQASISRDGVVKQRDGSSPHWPVLIDATILADLCEEAVTGKRGTLAEQVFAHRRRTDIGEIARERVSEVGHLITPELLTEIVHRLRAIIAGGLPGHNRESR